ncbi:MAG: Ig-like domain-containing protein, partial [Planctomycetota bacterium]
MRPAIFLASLSVLGFVPLLYGNEVNNPSMEGNFIYQDPLGDVAEYWTGWRPGGSGPQGHFSQGSHAHDGTKSQEIRWSGFGEEEFGYHGIYQQIDSLQAGQHYRASVWFKYRFETEGDEDYSRLTCGVGSDPNGGTDPGTVSNWTSVSDTVRRWEDGTWHNVITFFSPTGTIATIFIRVDGWGSASRVIFEPPYIEPAAWDIYCYIDDVVVQLLEIWEDSTVEATTPVPANGASYSEVTLTVLDPCSNPVEGIPASEIDVNCTGSDNIIVGPDAPTDANGQTKASIASTVAEIKTVSANIFSTVLSDTAVLHFCESSLSKLRAYDGGSSDYFGGSVSISGDYAVVGAYCDDDNGTSSGSAYIFRFDASSWAPYQKLLASDGAAYDYFGYSVSISGDYAIVGAQEDNDNGSDSGSAYIFKRDVTGWIQKAKLTASDGAS